MVRRRRNTVRKQLRSIRKAMVEIERVFARTAARLERAERLSQRARRGPPKLKLSARRRATLKLQGAYMGYMRQLGPRQKTRVRAVKAEQGFEPAIRLAKKLSRA